MSETKAESNVNFLLHTNVKFAFNKLQQFFGINFPQSSINNLSALCKSKKKYGKVDNQAF